MANAVVGYDPAAIPKMFRKYVESTDGKPRHTQRADYEVGLFSAFTCGAIPNNAKLQEALYFRMMDCAVEFEESGFIAGFEYAMSLMNGSKAAPDDNSTLTHPSQEKAQSADLKESQELPTVMTPPATQNMKPSPFEVARWNVEIPGSITTRQIAEMFECSNAKVVYRIVNNILPYLDEQSKKNFTRETGYTKQRRKVVFYRLNKAACLYYMEIMKPYKKYVNVAGGLAKMEELMQTIFPVSARKP